jgi:putative nucleotidyltransferase with HDIG domain
MMGEMKMMDHIVIHSIQVCRVATYLTEHLNNQNGRLNLDLIQAAALLHDITKTRSFKTRENHAQTGGFYLAKRGYPEIGELVRQHVSLDDYPHPVELGERQIINYADKRVLHDQVVSLDKRMDYILEKYGETPELTERIHWLWEKTVELEAKIFDDLTVVPRELNRLLNNWDFTQDFATYQKISQQN